MEQMKTKIDLMALTDEDIKLQSIGEENLWMVLVGENEYGPYETSSLKEYAQTYEYLFNEAHAYQFVSKEEIKPFFKFLPFQRRSPKLIPAQNLVNNFLYMILQNGKKYGPYNLEELRKKVDSGDISLRSEVSVDDEKTWIKLYEHHEFDRRLRKAPEPLPFVPLEESFNESQSFALKTISDKKSKKEEEDALIGLAFVSSGHDKGQKTKPSEALREENHKSPSFYRQKKFMGSIFAMLVLGLFLHMGKNEKQKFNYTATSETPTKVVEINNSERALNTKKVQNEEVKRIPASEPKEYPAHKMHKMDDSKAQWKSVKPKFQAKKPERSTANEAYEISSEPEPYGDYHEEPNLDQMSPQELEQKLDEYNDSSDLTYEDVQDFE